MSEAPERFIDSLKALFEDRSDSVHHRLEGDAQGTNLKIGQCIAKYMTKHKTLRRRMPQAAFQIFQDEQTSVRLAVKGLHGLPAYKYAARDISLAVLPEKKKVLEDRLIEEETIIGKQAQVVNIPEKKAGEEKGCRDQFTPCTRTGSRTQSVLPAADESPTQRGVKTGAGTIRSTGQERGTKTQHRTCTRHPVPTRRQHR